MLLKVKFSEILIFAHFIPMYFKLCMSVEAIILLLRISGINQKIIYNFETGNYLGAGQEQLDSFYLLSSFHWLLLSRLWKTVQCYVDMFTADGGKKEKPVMKWFERQVISLLLSKHIHIHRRQHTNTSGN